MKNLKTNEIIMCGIFSALTAVGAFIKIPIPFIPFTLQVFFVILAGLILGSRKGAISIGTYLLLGLIGIPVFTEGGGIGYILKPSFGYIIGFVAGAYLSGFVAEKLHKPTFKNLIIASFSGLAIVYILGMAYFYMISHLYLGTNISIANLFIFCFLAVVPGDIVLCVLACLISQRIIPILKGRR